MPLQNKVDPFGIIHAVAARGLFTGNRGVIHDAATRTLLRRRWTSRAWLICSCDFRGRRRDVMGYNGRGGKAGWTELFFLDEVTGLAAGHRPCFFCRRPAALAFAGCVASGSAVPKASEIDAGLHGERLASGGTAMRVDAQAMRALPDGTMVAHGDDAFAIRGGRLLPWSFAGYGDALSMGAASGWLVLTPPTTRAALLAGYQPVWHGSAGGRSGRFPSSA
ncbi:MAG TPA: hypothetical protein VNS02_00710 [Rhizobiaceae bacterium]|nr:hypothetical protein [Rhizobiaceae bacterium]